MENLNRYTDSQAVGEDTEAHILVVSFPAQGHLNPLLRLAKRIASKGPLVTFSSSVDVGHKIYAAAGATSSSPTPIGKGFIRFEFFDDGWEPHDPRRRNDVDALLAQLSTVGAASVADLIRRQASNGRPVLCVINNPFVPWVLDVATEMRIPCAVLWVQSCAVFTVYHHYHHALTRFPTDGDPDSTVTFPGLPPLKHDELPTFLLPSRLYPSLTEAILAQFHNLSKASWVFANSFEDLEHDAVSAISELARIIPVGPLVEADGFEPGVRGDMWKAADCMEWLDSQEPGSVVYVSVGSVAVLDRAETAEMAHGLRSSGRPFLWVVMESYRELLPEGFVEAVKGKGMVVGWSPQDRVLAHRSVACFLTHCGWNSSLEALTAGVPVIAYPQFGDQVPNAKFLVDVYRVGVQLKGGFGREELETCIRQVVEGPEAEGMRRRALEWKAAAREAVADGGSSDLNIEAFVNEIRGS